MCDAFGRAQNIQKQTMIARILPKLVIDKVQMAFDRADGIGAYTTQLGIVLQQEEQLEQGRRIARKDVLIDRLEIAVLDFETLVQRFGRRIRVHEDGFFELLQQHFIQAAQFHHSAVVTLHELFDRQGIRSVFITQHLGQSCLVVEKQPIFATSGQYVERKSDAPQEVFAVLQSLQLARRQEFVVNELAQRGGAEMAFGDPADELNIAQAARAAFDIRFEVVGGVVVAVMPSDLLLALFFEKHG